MRNINEYIEQSNLHLRLIYENELNEDLNNLIFSKHGNNRKHEQMFKRGEKNISNDDIKDLFIKSDNSIIDLCLNNKLKNNQQFVVLKIEKNNKCLSCICEIQNIDKQKMEYDIKVISVNRTDYEYKVKDVNLYLKIERDGRIKTIYI